MKEKPLKEILTSSIIAVTPNTSVLKAMQLMLSKDISCLLVLEDEKPVGIVTERNFVHYASQVSVGAEDIAIRQLMSSPVVTADNQVGVYEAYHRLLTERIRHLAVVDGQGRAVGVVTLSNILANLDPDYFVDVKKVSHVMTRKVICIHSQIPLQQVMLMMSEENVSCLIIVENGQPVGVVTERDTVKVLLQLKDIVLVPVEEIMSRSVYTVKADTPLHVAVTIMTQHKLRRLVAVDDEGKVVGLATQSDVVKGLEGKYAEALNLIIQEKEDTIQAATHDLSVKTTYLDNILKSSVDTGIVAVDLNFIVTYFNPAAEKMLGYGSRDLIGSSIVNFHKRFALNEAHFEQIIEKVIGGQSHTFVMEHYRDGGRAFFRARLSGIFDDNHELIGFFLMIHDITLRKKMEEELKKTHEGLEDRVKERTQELSRAMEGTVQAMALAVEMRDPYTSGHQRRVADLAAAIATKMGLAANIVEGIYMAGLIHDIGKIRVPSGILCNPGILTDAEFAILKPHPEIGFNILKEIAFPWPLAQIVLQHHERLDGSGYPNALKDADILVEAKVLAVADVVEAMFSHRPYRPSLGLGRALNEIYERRSLFYDSEVVAACTALLKSGEYTMDSAFGKVGVGSVQRSNTR